MCIHACVSAYGLSPWGARASDPPRIGVAQDLPDRGAGNWTHPLKEQFVVLTNGPFLHPQFWDSYSQFVWSNVRGRQLLLSWYHRCVSLVHSWAGWSTHWPLDSYPGALHFLGPPPLVLLQLHFLPLIRSLGPGTIRLGETAKLMSWQTQLGSCLSLPDCKTCVLPQKSRLRQLVAHCSVPNVILGMVSAVI